MGSGLRIIQDSKDEKGTSTFPPSPIYLVRKILKRTLYLIAKVLSLGIKCMLDDPLHLISVRIRHSSIFYAAELDF